MFVTATISRRTALASLKRTALASSSSSSSSSCSSRCWASTLLLSEPLVGSAIPASTCAAVTAAHQLDADGNTVDLLLVGGSQAPTQIPAGVNKVVHVQADDHPTAETVAAALAEVASSNDSSYTHVMGTSTKFGATVVPRTAALLGVSPVTDIVQILSSDTYVRPMYAGNALAKVQSTKTAKQVISIRPTSFDKAPLEDATTTNVETTSTEPFAGSEWVSESISSAGDASAPDLGTASVVVSGGRGMKSGDNFAMLHELATALGGGAVGASRAAVDAGMVPNDLQVGQTGKVVAPDLYVAVGISGAIQHLSGMKDSKTIVAINKDPEAPIFQVADYGLVADLFEAVPEMTQKLK